MTKPSQTQQRIDAHTVRQQETQIDNQSEADEDQLVRDKSVALKAWMACGKICAALSEIVTQAPASSDFGY
jgi:hypothetical protein